MTKLHKLESLNNLPYQQCNRKRTIVVIAIYGYATEFLIVTLRWVLLPIQHTTKSNESQNIPSTESHSLKSERNTLSSGLFRK